MTRELYFPNGETIPSAPAPGDILNSLSQIDGPGSGLDADTIDGRQLTDLALKNEVPGINWTTITTNYTAVAGDNLLVDTSTGPITVTLPATPAVNDKVSFADLKNSFSTNNLTISFNGNPIMGLNEDMIVSTDNISFTLLYTNITDGWRIV